jgi:hypothetical protein
MSGSNGNFSVLVRLAEAPATAIGAKIGDGECSGAGSSGQLATSEGAHSSM